MAVAKTSVLSDNCHLPFRAHPLNPDPLNPDPLNPELSRAAELATEHLEFLDHQKVCEEPDPASIRNRLTKDLTQDGPILAKFCGCVILMLHPDDRHVRKHHFGTSQNQSVGAFLNPAVITIPHGCIGGNLSFA